MLLFWGWLSLFVYALWLLRRPVRKRVVHYVVYTHNSAPRLEGVLRRIDRQARWRNQDYCVHLVDEASQDETLQIFGRYYRRFPQIKVHRCNGADLGEGEVTFRFDLREFCDTMSVET